MVYLLAEEVTKARAVIQGRQKSYDSQVTLAAATFTFLVNVGFGISNGKRARAWQK